MTEIDKSGTYTAYDVQAAKPEQVWPLIKIAIKKSDKIFVNDTIDGAHCDYSTLIPYNGFIEERFKYALTNGLKSTLTQMCVGDHYKSFLLQHFRCEFYKAKTLIACIDLEKGYLTVNTEVEGMEFQYPTIEEQISPLLEN